jgi:hypothetical protein
MEKSWNRSGSSSFKQPYSGGANHNHYRKKNDFSGQEYYSKTVKPVVQLPLKKESLQVELIENELLDINFSWLKNGGTNV